MPVIGPEAVKHDICTIYLVTEKVKETLILENPSYVTLSQELPIPKTRQTC